MRPGRARQCGDLTSVDESVHESLDRLDPGPARRLAGLFDLDGEIGLDSTLPPLWHWVYFLDAYRQRELGPDGHPRAGWPAPPGPGYRRMFAGGRVSFHEPLRFGVASRRVVRVLRQETKAGRSGPLTFATIEIAVSQDGKPALVEEQDIVYLPLGGAPRPEAPPDPPGADEAAVFSLALDASLLFRFSALTYNAHRIHYDRGYAESEGHPDLVVHGPLQALLLMQAGHRARPQSDSVARFEYRLQAPAYLGAGPLTVYARETGQLTLRDAEHRITATATATW
jgi:3-methylfumaryl-CoA hydratase